MAWGKVRQFFGIHRKSYFNEQTKRGYSTPRRALIVGINDYKNEKSLKGCVADAQSMARVLSSHQPDKDMHAAQNYACTVLTSADYKEITAPLVRQKWAELFEDIGEPDQQFRGDVLFYFSGHGYVSDDYGGHLVMSDSDIKRKDFGLDMNSLIHAVAHRPKVHSVVMIIDACSSGDIANSPYNKIELAELPRGLSILSASLPRQEAWENDGQGLFTKLIVGALEGGAADVLGHVSPAAMFAYAEAALGPELDRIRGAGAPKEQRPMMKTHTSDWGVIRRCKPAVPKEELQSLEKYFPDPEYQYPFDPSYEADFKTDPDYASYFEADPAGENIKTFQQFKRYQVAGLLEPVKEKMREEVVKHRVGTENDLYWAAAWSVPVRLTPLGKFYRVIMAK